MIQPDDIVTDEARYERALNRIASDYMLAVVEGCKPQNGHYALVDPYEVAHFASATLDGLDEDAALEFARDPVKHEQLRARVEDYVNAVHEAGIPQN